MVEATGSRSGLGLPLEEGAGPPVCWPWVTAVRWIYARRSFLPPSWLGFPVALLFAGAAGATTMIPLEPLELATISDAVFLGRVTGVTVLGDARGAFHTYVDLAIEEDLGGDLGGPGLTLKQPGGRTGGGGRTLLGTPRFQAGERVLVFARRSRDGTLHVAHLSQGRFRIEPDPATGEDLALRDLAGARLVPRPGRTPSPVREVRRAAGVVRDARAGLRRRRPASTERPPIVTRPPELESRHLKGLGGGPPALLGPARWFEPDSGIPVPVDYDQAGIPLFFTLLEIEGALDRATAAWSDVPTATMLLQRGLPGPAAPSLPCDGTTAVVFNDPFGEIDPPVNCAGTVALGGFCDDPGQTQLVNGVTFTRITEGDVLYADGFDACPGMDDLCVIEEIAAHEIGHTIGLDHSSESPTEPDPLLSDATMYFRLHDDRRCSGVRTYDVSAVSFVYPALEGVFPVLGRRLALRDRLGDPEGRRVAVRLADAGIPFPAASPIDVGAVLTLHNPLTGETDPISLPAGPDRWRGLGNPPGSRGFRYTDRTRQSGPCSGLVLRPGRMIRVLCRGGGIGYTLDEPAGQGAVAVQLDIGGTEYCAEFDENIVADTTPSRPGQFGHFRATAVPPPVTCPVP